MTTQALLAAQKQLKAHKRGQQPTIVTDRRCVTSALYCICMQAECDAGSDLLSSVRSPSCTASALHDSTARRGNYLQDHKVLPQLQNQEHACKCALRSQEAAMAPKAEPLLLSVSQFCCTTVGVFRSEDLKTHTVG